MDLLIVDDVPPIAESAILRLLADAPRRDEFVIDATRGSYLNAVTRQHRKINSKPHHSGRGNGRMYLEAHGDCTPSAATRKKNRDKRKKRNKARK